MESILISIKNMLGITEDYDAFDATLIMHINSVFMNLTQLGVGPSKGFFIEDRSNKWTEFIGENSNLEAIKSYIHLKVKLLFDPPMNSSIINSMNQQINELEWRLNVEAESINRREGGQNG